jgi:hypothetical protein
MSRPQTLPRVLVNTLRPFIPTDQEAAHDHRVLFAKQEQKKMQGNNQSKKSTTAILILLWCHQNAVERFFHAKR